MTREQRIFLITIVAFAIPILLLIGLTCFMYFYLLKQQDEKISKLKEQVSKLENIRRQIPQIQRTIEKLKYKLPEAKSVVPPKGAQVFDNFYTKLEEVCMKAGVLQHIPESVPKRRRIRRGVMEKKVPASIEEEDFKITVYGKFHALHKFIYQLECDRQYLYIRDFSISKKAKGSFAKMGDVRELKINLSFFYFKKEIPF